MAQRYYLEGFRPPYDILDAAGVKALQRELGVAMEGNGVLKRRPRFVKKFSR